MKISFLVPVGETMTEISQPPPSGAAGNQSVNILCIFLIIPKSRSLNELQLKVTARRAHRLQEVVILSSLTDTLKHLQWYHWTIPLLKEMNSTCTVYINSANLALKVVPKKICCPNLIF